MKKLLTVTLSIFFLMGLTSPVLAASDSTSDNFVPDVDLQSASLVTSVQTDQGVPEVANIGITVAPGSHLPALIIFEIDVDNDTATGGTTILSAPLDTAEGGGIPPYKPGCVGYDFFVVVALRGQSDTSMLALSDTCMGSSKPCVERGTQCTGCTDAYQLGDLCAGGANCYNVITSVQTACNEGTCYQFPDPCPNDVPCGMGLITGEWYMAIDLLSKPSMRGNKILSFPYNPNNETDICLTIPWVQMIAEAIQEYNNQGKTPFTLQGVLDNLPHYQVSVWYDTANDDDDDYMSSGNLLNLSDFMPNGGGACNAAGEYNQHPPCLHNSWGGYGNLNVDANDVGDFLEEFGRSVFSRPCPNCKN